MPTRPPGLIYAVNDSPPTWVAIVLGLQHLCVVAISFVFPVVVVRAMGGTAAQAEFMVNMSMLAAGIGTVLQALPRGPVGSGYLCPMVCGPSYLSASILAAQTGGAALVSGMTAFASLFVVGASRVMHHLRILFPTEIVGLVVAMVGLTVLKLSATHFLGLDDAGRIIGPESAIVALITLATMCALSVWGRGFPRLACVIIGMAVGYSAAGVMGLLTREHANEIVSATWIAFPFTDHPGFAFDASMAVPFAVAAVCSLLKNVGDITTCQKINDADWQRTDMVNVRQGMLADGIGCLVGGVAGGHGLSGSSSNIGMSLATGATSRTIAWITGGLLIVMAFCPKLSSIFAIMPDPVIGAVLIFVVSFMVIAELQVARAIQMDLVPKTFPPFPEREDLDLYALLEPAREIGGDYYDFFMCDDHRLCLVVGDVCGKGMPAALFMAVTRTLLRALQDPGCGPAATLSRLNDELAQDNDASMFVTIFLAIVDLRTGACTFARGGHNPPFLIPADGPVTMLPAIDGPLIGVFEGAAFAEESFFFNDTATTEIYTDGVTEAINPAEEVYGVERTRAQLSRCRGETCEGLLTCVRDAVTEYADGADQFDDITMLAFRFLKSTSNETH